MSNSPSKSEEEITRLAIESLLEDARKFQNQRSLPQKATRKKPHLHMNKNFLKRLLQNHEYSNGRKMAQRDSSIRGAKVEESDTKDMDNGKQSSKTSVETEEDTKASTDNGATFDEEKSKGTAQTCVDDREDILVSLEKAIKGDETEEDDYEEDIDLDLRVEEDEDVEEDVEESSTPKPEVKEIINDDETTQDLTTLVAKFDKGRSGDDTTITPNQGDGAASSAEVEETTDEVAKDKGSELFNPPEANEDETNKEVIQPASIIIPEKTRSAEYTVKEKIQNTKRKIEEEEDSDDDDEDNLVIEISDSDSDSYNDTEIKRARTSPSDN